MNVALVWAEAADTEIHQRLVQVSSVWNDLYVVL